MHFGWNWYMKNIFIYKIESFTESLHFTFALC